MRSLAIDDHCTIREGRTNAWRAVERGSPDQGGVEPKGSDVRRTVRMRGGEVTSSQLAYTNANFFMTKLFEDVPGCTSVEGSVWVLTYEAK